MPRLRRTACSLQRDSRSGSLIWLKENPRILACRCSPAVRRAKNGCWAKSAFEAASNSPQMFARLRVGSVVRRCCINFLRVGSGWYPRCLASRCRRCRVRRGISARLRNANDTVIALTPASAARERSVGRADFILRKP